MAPRNEIVKAKLLLVEGADALHFFISALKAFGVDDVQVIDFGGIRELTTNMIFPGFGADSSVDQNSLLTGTLEDLCLNIVKDCSTFECVDQYVQCIQSEGHEITRLHKTKLHTYLSGNNDFVGLKIGEASKAGAWDWDHKRLYKFKAIITTM